MLKINNKSFKIENIAYVSVITLVVLGVYAFRPTSFLESVMILLIGGVLGLAKSDKSENKIINPDINKVEVNENK